jgi:hypothetical protein
VISVKYEMNIIYCSKAVRTQCCADNRKPSVRLVKTAEDTHEIIEELLEVRGRHCGLVVGVPGC